MFVAQALQRSTVGELEQPGFDPLKEHDSSFDFASLMGHIDPYGTYWPSHEYTRSGETTMKTNLSTAPVANRRRYFIGGSDVRIIMGNDEPALIRLWR